MIEQETNAIDLESATPHYAGPPARPWLITFADLICVLLAFFVLLANISKIEHDKARDALRSLSETLAFATEGKAGSKTAQGSESLVGPQAVRERLATRVREVFPGVKMEEVAARNELHFALPIAAVFYGRDVKSEAKPVLAEVAGALKRGAPGFRIEAEAKAGVGGTDPQVAIALASALAVALVAEGAPKANVAAGIDRESPNEIRFTIRARAEDEPRIGFQNIVPRP
jgi:hypothetical protein